MKVFFTYFESLNHEKIQHELHMFMCFLSGPLGGNRRVVVGLKPGGDGLLLGFFRLWTFYPPKLWVGSTPHPVTVANEGL